MLAFLLRTVVRGHLASVTKGIRQVVRAVHGIEVTYKKKLNCGKKFTSKTVFYLQLFSFSLRAFRNDRVKFSPDTYKPRQLNTFKFLNFHFKNIS